MNQLKHATHLFVFGVCHFALAIPAMAQIKALPTSEKHRIVLLTDKLIDAYAECYDNLKVHAEGFPTVEYLRSISVMGQKGYGMGDVGDVGDGKDTPGSELIIASVDRDDPRPVWVGAWGGANNVAQAIWKVRATRSKAELDKFLSKLRVFDILGQDDAGAWIAKNFPEVLYIRAVKVYGWQPPKNGDYQRNDIQSHGPLGAAYPNTKWATEGDTPAFMHVFLQKETRPFWADTNDEVLGIDGRWHDTNHATIWRWRGAYQNDFAARMDWTVKPYEDANHPPVVKLGHADRLTAKKGDVVQLSAEGCSDPDGDALSYHWFCYGEVGTFLCSSGTRGQPVPINSFDKAKAAFTVPTRTVMPPGIGTIHIILAVTDHGTPRLTRYRRLIVDVEN